MNKATIKNLLTIHDPFMDADFKNNFIKKHRFMVCENQFSAPMLRSKNSSQFLMTATFTCEAWAKIKNGEMTSNRKSSNLVPTAFLFEADGTTIQEQWDNIRESAFEHILMITFSGKKSLHILVPIHEESSLIFSQNHPIFKKVWRDVAKELFKNPSIYDENAVSIGRLSRMPATVRNDNGKEQKCIWLNDGAYFKCLDIRPYIETHLARQKSTSLFSELSELMMKYKMNAESPTDALQHLEKSNAKYPTVFKQIAIDVLVKNHVPSSNNLPTGGSYIGVIAMLKNKFPQLLETFVKKVKNSHPTCLPKNVNDYLT